MMNHSKLYLTIIIIASIATHFLFFGHPRGTVFDEVHFGKFISGYFTHEYFFDIHPPLGKLLISGMGYITGFKPGFSFAEIGQQFPDRHYLWLRLLPILAGTLLPIVIFLLILELGLSPLAAFAGGLLIILENALLVQSRFILLDSFLLLFGFLALFFYFKYKNSSSTTNYKLQTTNLFLSGLFASLAFSVKWTGLTFLSIIGILYLISWFKSSEKIKSLVKGLAFLVIVPIVIYFSIFAIHLSLLTKSGQGDAFMTPEFRKTLEGSAENQNPNLAVEPLSGWGKFIELNKQMHKSNTTLTAGHPYSSKWYTWPFMIRPIYYWYQGSSPNNPTPTDYAPESSRIYFFGNPVIWWASTVAILYLLISVLCDLYRKRTWPKLVPVILGGAYLLNMLPFIGVSRVMFLYHYMIGLIFAIFALVFLIDQIRNKKRAFIALLIASFTAFIFFAPLTYGLPLTEKAYHLKIWLKTWI